VKLSCDVIETGLEGFCRKIGDLDEVHYGHEGIDLVLDLPGTSPSAPPF